MWIPTTHAWTGRLALALLTLFPAVALADPLVLSDGKVQVDASNVPASIQLTVSGGQQPYTGKVYLALAGEAFQPVDGVPWVDPSTVVVMLPRRYQAPKFAWYAVVSDAAGAQATLASDADPRVHSQPAPVAAEPPVPDGPTPLPPLPEGAPPAPEASPAPSTEPAPHPKVQSGRRQRAIPATGEELPASRGKRRVRTQRVVECCGIPIWGGGRSPLFLVGAAVSLLGSLGTAAVAVVFAVDAFQAQRMVLAVNRSEAGGDALPGGCGSYSACRQPYQRALWMDLTVVVVGVVATLALGAVAAGLLVAGSAWRTE
jgi:hypothetical protein